MSMLNLLSESHFTSPRTADLDQLQVNACDCKGTVLIVDDNPFNLMMLENMLNLVGVKVEKAENGQEAVEMFMDNRQKCCCKTWYKLVLMDLDMPVMDGFQAAEKIIEYQKRNNREADLNELSVNSSQNAQPRQDNDLLQIE